MRRLMWFTSGFAIACGLCIWCLPQTWLLPAVLTVFACAVGLFAANSAIFSRIAATILLGAALGFGWYFVYSQHYLSDIRPLNETKQTIEIEASDYSYETDYGIGFDGTVVLHGKPYRIRTYINEDISLSPGDSVTGTFRVSMSAPEDYAEGTYHAGIGVFLLAYQKSEIAVKKAEEISWRHYPAIFSRKIEQTLYDCFPEDTVSFAKALLLGDTTDLSYEVDTALKISGIRHVVAVSGLHVAILFALIQMATLKNPVLSALLGLPVLLAFAALAGFTPSVSRACMMCGLMMFGKLIDREYDGLTSLSFAVLVMLILNPMAITSVSMQLSVGSVAGIFLFYNPVYHWLPGTDGKVKSKNWTVKIRKWMAASVSVTISAMVFTTPLCAYFFGVVSLIGVVTNLVTLWAVSLIFYGILAVCAVNVMWHSAAVLLAAVVSWLIRYVLLCAKLLGQFPLAAVYTKSVYIVLWLIFAWVLLAVFLIQKTKRPGVFGFCLVFSLMLCIFLSWMEPLTTKVQMTVLDVGQGQSILLQCDGRTYIVDCGGDSDEKTADLIAESLLAQGICRLDGIIVTHLDRDHAGALPYLLSRVDSDFLFLPDAEETLNLPDTDSTCIYVEKDQKLEFNGTRIQIFGSGYKGSGNENSLCVLFEHENCAILITGDRSIVGEQMLLRKVTLPKVDVLIAGHHGSKDSTGEALLRATSPETVIISVGEENIYGHPSEETLSRLQRTGCVVYRTDQMGTIRYRR